MRVVFPYTVDVEPFWRGAADYVDQLLRGISLAELPIQQPKTFAFVINLATARALDLTVPRELLVQARRVVERRRVVTPRELDFAARLEH